MSDPLIERLRSSDQHEVAYALSDALIGHVRQKPEIGGERVADALVKLRDEVWGNPDKSNRQTVAFFKGFVEIFPRSSQSHLAEAYARMGHLYELASLVARENLITHELDGVAPGGAREFVQRAASAEEAVAALNKPVFEVVMTAHPTNVNGADTITSLRMLGRVVDQVRQGQADEAALHQAIADFSSTSLLKVEDDRTPANLRVDEETEQMLYYLGNVYDDLPSIYEGYEEALRQKGDYNPLDLQFQLKFGSWGSSGDKDGNQQVNSYTTLQALAQHREEIAKRYLADVEAIDHPDLQPWKAKLSKAYATAGGIAHDMGGLHLQGHHISDEIFNGRSLRLESAKIDVPAFEAAILAVYEETGDKVALSLLRRIRTFGADFAKIEYRENADEYSRVVGLLVPGYETLSPDARTEALTAILQEPGKAHALKNAMWEEIVKKGAGQPYSVEEAHPIAYHTLKRMELARDHQGMVQDNVLAEFTHSSQLLEALFLQHAVSEPGKELRLGLVPLFESPESMQAAPAIMERVYHNPAYRRHLSDLAADALRPVQQVQIAHSDNARRSGLPAARAFIYDAHQQIRAATLRNGIDVQFFEGGSSSDIYRGGVRATSSAVKAYDLHDFAKFTFQGGDMLNYFNYTPSIQRLFARNLAHGAIPNLQHGRGDEPSGLWKDRIHYPDEINDEERVEYTREVNDLVCRALKGTLNDYQTNAFTTTGLGHLLKELGYDEEKDAGTAGSRRPSRLSAAFSKVKSVLGANIGSGPVSNSVDIKSTRTITFSESLQHAGLVPTMIGARTIYKNLRNEVNAVRQGMRDKLEAGETLTPAEAALRKFYPLGASDAEKLPPEAIKFLFDNSRLFRDVVVRVSLGVALTNFEQIKDFHPRLRNDPFMEQLEQECRDAANICCAALSGKYPEVLLGKSRTSSEEQASGITTADLRKLLVDQFPELKQLMLDKSRYLGFIQAVKADLEMQEEVPADLRRLLHAAGDTVTHGRFLPADDSAMGAYLRKKLLPPDLPEQAVGGR